MVAMHWGEEYLFEPAKLLYDDELDEFESITFTNV